MAKSSGSTRAKSPSINSINIPDSAIGETVINIGKTGITNILKTTFKDNDTEINEAFSLLDSHGGNKNEQAVADLQIYELINDKKSKVGKALRDIAAINKAHFLKAMDAREKRTESLIEKDFPMERLFTKSDISDAEVRENIRKRLGNRTDIAIYRGGGRKNVEAWTKDPRGADTGAGRIQIDHTSTIRTLLKTHYLLGGISQMVGAPGESEVLFVKKK